MTFSIGRYENKDANQFGGVIYKSGTTADSRDMRAAVNEVRKTGEKQTLYIAAEIPDNSAVTLDLLVILYKRGLTSNDREVLGFYEREVTTVAGNIVRNESETPRYGAPIVPIDLGGSTEYEVRVVDVGASTGHDLRTWTA